MVNIRQFLAQLKHVLWSRLSSAFEQKLPKLPYVVVLPALNRSWQEHDARVKAFMVERLLDQPVLFTDRFNVQYLLYPSDNLYDRYYNHGYSEVAEQDFCASYIKPGMTAFDVGANYGMYTMLLSKLVGLGQVHAFEPEQWNFYRLQCNLVINRCKNVKAHPCAVFSSTGEVTLNVFQKEQFGWHTLGTPNMVVGGQRVLPNTKCRVRSVSLDEYCDQNRIARIDFLKVDVEGAELDVFQGARRLLRHGRIECVLFEISKPMIEGMGHEPVEIFDFLRGFGMSLHAIAAGGTLSPAPVEPGASYQNFVALRTK